MNTKVPDFIESGDKPIAVSCVSGIHALPAREFPLHAAAEDAGDNAMRTECCRSSNSSLSKQYSGHIGLNAPFARLIDFVKHYSARKLQ